MISRQLAPTLLEIMHMIIVHTAIRTVTSTFYVHSIIIIFITNRVDCIKQELVQHLDIFDTF